MPNADQPASADRPATICFASFRLDLRGGRLTRAGGTIPLRPKTWGVLLHLAQQPGVLVTKDELLDAVWPNVAVTPDTLTKSIGELRLALGDESRAPRYIETVHRRGFRFIAETTSVSASRSLVSGFEKAEPAATGGQPETAPFVGRAAEQPTLGLGSGRHFEEPPEFGLDPIIDANSHHALALWFLGHHERARATVRAGIEAARASGASFTQAAALSLGAVVEIFHGNATDALALAEEALVLSKERGFAYWYAMASAVRGQAWVLRGHTREGLDELARARSALHAIGTSVFLTHILAFQAEAHRRNGSLAEALTAANEGLALAESSLDRTYRPELWRLKGELLLAVGSRPSTVDSARRVRGGAVARRLSTRNWEEAERCLLRAVELARESEAKSLELRAAASLARAWQAWGREAEAYAMLARVCEWFAPETQSPDLDEARTLLDELRSSGEPRAEPAPRKVRAARRKISANLPKTFRT